VTTAAVADAVDRLEAEHRELGLAPSATDYTDSILAMAGYVRADERSPLVSTVAVWRHPLGATVELGTYDGYAGHGIYHVDGARYLGPVDVWFDEGPAELLPGLSELHAVARRAAATTNHREDTR